MIRYYYTSPEYFKNWDYNDVTLATQCSANHLHHVVMLAKRWTGPISVAVFAPNLVNKLPGLIYISIILLFIFNITYQNEKLLDL